jgi:hypothetical protein
MAAVTRAFSSASSFFNLAEQNDDSRAQNRLTLPMMDSFL